MSAGYDRRSIGSEPDGKYARTASAQNDGAWRCRRRRRRWLGWWRWRRLGWRRLRRLGWRRRRRLRRRLRRWLGRFLVASIRKRPDDADHREQDEQSRNDKKNFAEQGIADSTRSRYALTAGRRGRSRVKCNKPGGNNVKADTNPARADRRPWTAVA
jgi:hypothetical protein